MVCMHYGSALGTFGEQRYSLNAPNHSTMHLGAFGVRVYSPNVSNVLP